MSAPTPVTAKKPNQARQYAGGLVATLTSDYTPVWDVTDTTAETKVRFWHPAPQGDMRPLGSIAVVGSHEDPTGMRAVPLVGNEADEGNPPALASPCRYRRLWTDVDIASDRYRNRSIWRPLAPEGYVSLGDVAQVGWGVPPKDSVWCVRDDLAAEGAWAREPAWDDETTRAHAKSGIWEVRASTSPPVSAESHPEAHVPCGTFRVGPRRDHTTSDCPKKVLVLRGYDGVATNNNLPPSLSRGRVPDEGAVLSGQGTDNPGGRTPFGFMPFTVYFPPTDGKSLACIKHPFCPIYREVYWVVEAVYNNNSAATVKHAVMPEEEGDEEEDNGPRAVLNLTLPPYQAAVAFSKLVRRTAVRADGAKAVQERRFRGRGFYLSGVALRDGTRWEDWESDSS